MNKTVTEAAAGSGHDQRSASASIGAAALPTQTWLVITLLFFGGVLRFHQLGSKGLWGDEIWTAQWSRGTLGQIWIDLTRIPDLPLMYALVNIATRFGEGEFWVRLPSALFGVAGILMFYVMANRLLGRYTALVGTILITLSPIHIWYSQDARYYAQLSFLGTASLYFFYSFLTSDKGRLGIWLRYLVTTIAALYTHLFAGWIIVAQAIFVAYYFLDRLLRPHNVMPVSKTIDRSKGIWLAGALFVIVIVTVPITLRLIETLQTGVSAGGEGMARFRLPPAWPDFLTVALLLEVTQRFSGSSIGSIVLPLFFLIGFVTTWRSTRSVSVLALCLIFAPLLTTFFLDIRHGVTFKYFFYLLPVFLLLVAAGITWCASKLYGSVRAENQRKFPGEAPHRLKPYAENIVIPLVLLLSIGLIYVQPIDRLYQQARMNDWRSIAAYLRTHVQPEDVVYTERWGFDALTYYLPSTTDVTILRSNQLRWQRLGFQAPRIWLVGLQGEYQEAAQGQFRKIADVAWHDPRWQYPGSLKPSESYPVTEPQASIYVFDQPRNWPIVDFVDIDDAQWTDVTYRHVAPGQQTVVDLTLQASAPRTLALRYFDHPGKDFQVLVDGQPLGTVTGGQLGGWQVWQGQLPETVSSTVRITIIATGPDAIGLDGVELAYSSPPRNLVVADNGANGAFVIVDQGIVGFEKPQNAASDGISHLHLNPGDETLFKVMIPDQGGRILAVTTTDLPNQSLAIDVNGYPLGATTSTNQDSTWHVDHFFVPGGIGDHALIQIRALGPNPSEIRSVEVQRLW